VKGGGGGGEAGDIRRKGGRGRGVIGVGDGGRTLALYRRISRIREQLQKEQLR